MSIYHTTRWRKKRKWILHRDKDLCQECKRYGKRVDAETVHHAYPCEEYPEYGYEDWNLVSLCLKCHNSMHDRNTNMLTEKGEALKQRVSPPVVKHNVR